MKVGRWTWLLWLLPACTSGTNEGNAFGSNSGPVGTSPTSGSTEDTDAASEDSSGTSGEGSTGGPGSTSTDAVDSTGAATTDDPTGATTNACMGAPTGMSAIGETCTDGCECGSGICYSLPLVGSACSACLNDVDCQTAGVGTCSIDVTTESAACTNGELGVMCEPAAMGCAAGLSCAQLIDTGGVLPDTFCSECTTTADCTAGEVCTPNVIIDGLQPGGFLQCIPQGSGADGTFCPATGDASACASGFCAVADIGGVGIAEVGVCGPCAVDGDCPAGMTCTPPEVDENGATPSVCV